LKVGATRDTRHCSLVGLNFFFLAMGMMQQILAFAAILVQTRGHIIIPNINDCPINYFSANPAFSDRFIALNSRGHVWTVYTSVPPMRRGFREYCSIVIIGPINRCFMFSDKFKAYLSSPSVMFVWIIYRRVNCAYTRFDFIQQAVAPHFLLRLNMKMTEVKYQYILCPSCFHLRIPILSMGRIIPFEELIVAYHKENKYFHNALYFASTHVAVADRTLMRQGRVGNIIENTRYFDQICPYQRNYARRRRDNIMCLPIRLLTELLTEHANLTAEYQVVSSDEFTSHKSRRFAGGHQMISTIQLTESPLIRDSEPRWHVTDFQWNSCEYMFRYHICSSTISDALDFRFLLTPFGPWVIPLILFSKLMIFGIQTTISWLKRKTKMTGSGNILGTVHELFLFIILSSYEVFMSSDVTAPPPPKKYDNLKDLLQKYKIIETSPQNSADYKFLRRIAPKERLSLDTLNSSLVSPYTTDIVSLSDFGRVLNYLNQCNFTVKEMDCSGMPLGLYPWNINFVRRVGPQQALEGISFLMTSKDKLAGISRHLHELGILNLWKNYRNFLISLKAQRNTTLINIEKFEPKAFQLLQWRILPTFIFYGILIAASILIFCLEKCYFIFIFFIIIKIFTSGEVKVKT